MLSLKHFLLLHQISNSSITERTQLLAKNSTCHQLMNTQHVSKDEERDLEDQTLTRITKSNIAMIRKGHSALYALPQGATPVNM